MYSIVGDGRRGGIVAADCGKLPVVVTYGIVCDNRRGGGAPDSATRVVSYSIAVDGRRGETAAGDSATSKVRITSWGSRVTGYNIFPDDR